MSMLKKQKMEVKESSEESGEEEEEEYSTLSEGWI